MVKIEFKIEQNKALAYDDKLEIGICEFIENENTWNIIHTVVDNNYRGQGIARKLVDSVIENAKKYNKNLIAECSYAQKVLERLNNTPEEDDLRQLTNYEISLICSNLARGCEKQYMKDEQKLFSELAKYYEDKEKGKKGTLQDISNKITENIDNLNKAMETADDFQDRGAKRIITWATKSSTIMKIIIENYQKKGIEYIKNTKIWVCDICGFVFVGDTPPKVCPICKVPNFKMLEVK